MQNGWNDGAGESAIAHLTGPMATIQNSPLVTFNKARIKRMEHPYNRWLRPADGDS
jgi:hypothetical protein